MSRAQATILGIFLLLCGAGLGGYVLLVLPPYLAANTVNSAALILLLVGLFLAVTGLGTLLALLLHRRWPLLAGQAPRRPGKPPPARAAIRQGLLLGLTVVILATLSALGALDIIIVLVTLLLAGLVEAFAQARR